MITGEIQSSPPPLDQTKEHQGMLSQISNWVGSEAAAAWNAVTHMGSSDGKPPLEGDISKASIQSTGDIKSTVMPDGAIAKASIPPSSGRIHSEIGTDPALKKGIKGTPVGGDLALKGPEPHLDKASIPTSSGDKRGSVGADPAFGKKASGDPTEVTFDKLPGYDKF